MVYSYTDKVYNERINIKTGVIRMMCGVIDLGSNTIRLTVYRIKDHSFKILFTQKTMAGLVGYVQDGYLKQGGIDKACEVLSNYKSIFENFEINDLNVFATASLRNIKNTDEAVSKILERTGLKVEVISGEEEAILDFEGATQNIDMNNGLLVDIGGGSTELVTYNNSNIVMPVSIPVGSLSLYTKYVEKILPKKRECKKMRKIVEKELEKSIEQKKYPIICGVGGTVRAVLKLNNFMFSMAATNNEVTVEHLRYILETLNEKNSSSLNLILKICPDRIHTIIPGLCLLRTIASRYESETIMVSSYGVREGYLYDRVIKNKM